MIEYFSKLTNAEVQAFGKFVRSPYHNTNRNVFRLVRYLSSKHPRIKPAHIYKINIFRNIFRYGKYNEMNYHKLMSEFRKVFEQFLVYWELEKDISKKDYFLLKSLRLRKLNERFDLAAERLRSRPRGSSSEMDYYLNNTLIQNELHDYYTETSFIDSKKILQSYSSDLDNLFALSKLKVYNHSLNYGIYYGKQSLPDERYYKEIISYIEKN